MGAAITIALCVHDLRGRQRRRHSLLHAVQHRDLDERHRRPADRLLYVALIVLAFVFSYFHIELTAKVLGVCLVAEVVCLLIFDVSVMAPGGKDGVPMEALNPLQDRGNSDAKAGLGALAGVGVLRRLLVVGRLRDGAELRRGGPQPEEDDGVRHVHLGDRSRHPLHAHAAGPSSRLGRRALVQAIARQFGLARASQPLRTGYASRLLSARRTSSSATG